jgi:hypothetical protein
MITLEPLLTKTVVVTKDQVYCDLGGESVILGLKAGAYYGLNATGSFIWQLIQRPRQLKEVRDQILNEYQVEPERCEQDLLALIQKLVNRGLVEIIDGKIF